MSNKTIYLGRFFCLDVDSNDPTFLFLERTLSLLGNKVRPGPWPQWGQKIGRHSVLHNFQDFPSISVERLRDVSAICYAIFSKQKHMSKGFVTFSV